MDTHQNIVMLTEIFQRLKMMTNSAVGKFTITDWNMWLTLNSKGIYLMQLPSHEIEMTSETLEYCLRFDWGFNTTLVNARVQFYGDGYEKFKAWEQLFTKLNHG